MEALPDRIIKVLTHIHNNSTIVVNDENLVAQKLLLISQGGSQNLCVVTDYDATLTKFWVEPNKKFVGGHNVPMTTNLVTEQFKTKVKELSKHYLPFETDLKTSLEVKEAKMLEWFNAAHQLFLEEGFSLEKIKQIVSQFHTDFRYLVDEFFTLTHKLNVPVIVLSAGLTDIIETTFEKYRLNKDNVTVVSNKMIFSNEPPYIATEFGPVIHVFNKGNIELPSYPQAHHCIQKQNGIIVGDAVGDNSMGNSFQIVNKLKIGIVNHGPTKVLLHLYLQHFDIVLLGDPDFSLINQIVSLVE